MFAWWKKKLSLTGLVFFRGDLPSRPSDFEFLRAKGIDIQPSSNNTDSAWSLKLSHVQWGQAEIFSGQPFCVPPSVFDHAFLSDEDKQAAMSCRSIIRLNMTPSNENILRDRKLMLRYLRVIMGNDGVVALDFNSQKVWMRDDLDDELRHNADLDVEGLFTIHAVKGNNGKCEWLHTHGLAEIGTFDLDIINPCGEVRANAWELFRTFALAALEGRLSLSGSTYLPIQPGGKGRLVAMNRFLANADYNGRAELAKWVDDGHRRSHYVICDPEASAIARLFGAKSIRPSEILSGQLPENPLFTYSTDATNLMSERALNTYCLLRDLHQEFQQYQLSFFVKLGYPVSPGPPSEREHLCLRFTSFLMIRSTRLSGTALIEYPA